MQRIMELKYPVSDDLVLTAKRVLRAQEDLDRAHASMSRFYMAQRVRSAEITPELAAAFAEAQETHQRAINTAQRRLREAERKLGQVTARWAHTVGLT